MFFQKYSSLTLLCLLLIACGAPRVATPPVAVPYALQGRLSSVEEGAMEGVVVSARRFGAALSLSVVSDAQGRFQFPASQLQSGEYSLRIRAAGYELAAPVTVRVDQPSAGKPKEIELNLRSVADLSSQLSNAEWIASFPGEADQKKFLYGCVGCHTLERIAKSKYDTAGFIQVMKRMASYTNNSHIERPQLRVKARNPTRDFGPDFEKQAAYLASVNLSAGPWRYPLKTLPRVKGAGTRVLITEYDLPRKPMMPHDVIVDAQGMVWYSLFDEQFLGRLDPKTLKVTEFPIPVLRPGFPKGTLDLETDPQGNFWLSHMFQSGAVKFDKKTETFQTFPLPKGVVNDDSQQSMVGPQSWTVDNKVWINDAGIPGMHRLDMATGKFETWKPYENMKGPHSVYGIYADSKNNIFFMDFGGESVGRIDAASGQLTLTPTPTPRSRPRRGRMDAQDRVWFAEWRAEKIGMYDTKTGKFREWEVPTPFTAPYDVVLDRLGKVWTAGMNTDRVLRMDLESGAFTEYPLPNPTNIRRVFVDNATNPPTFWVGNNHHATIVKLEPLE